jgi:tagatose-1,6-bisphosphate aldolase non-catalytic subunit AgaZ/GatZ
MAGFTKVNPAAIAAGTLYSTLQLKAFLINPDAEIVATSLTTAATRLAEEFGTTGALFQVKSDGGSMIVIGDGHALDVDIVTRRAAHVLNVATSAVTVTQLTSLYGV